MSDIQDRIGRLRDFERGLVRDATFLLDDHRDTLVRMRDGDGTPDPTGAPHRRPATTVRRHHDRWARLLRDRRRTLAAEHPDRAPDERGAADELAFYREYRRRLVDELDRTEHEVLDRPVPLPHGSGPLRPGDVSALIAHHDALSVALYPHRYRTR